jgi:heme exporter protein A
VSTDTPNPDGLVVDGLSRRFGPRWVLIRATFAVPPGGSMLLLGPNGSGKTTLLRTLATALKPHAGTATFQGQALWEQRRELRRKVALLSHASRLYSDLSAAQNLSVWARMGGFQADIGALLERVGLADTGRRPAGAFSAGMKRRLALARAMLKEPELVLFDEPFSALDPQGRELVGEVLEGFRARGATLVLSTHHARIGARFCEQAMRLDGGRIVWRGPAAEARDEVPA